MKVVKTLFVSLAPFVAAIASAQSFNFDTSSMIAHVPSTGTAIHSITGTYTRSATTYMNFGLDSESDLILDSAWDQPLTPTFNPAFTAFRNSGAIGTYTGPVLDITLSSSTLLGMYDANGSYMFTRSYYFDEYDGWMLYDTGRKGFKLEVLAPQAVPEPATMAALGLGAVAVLRRRKRA